MFFIGNVIIVLYSTYSHDVGWLFIVQLWASALYVIIAILLIQEVQSSDSIYPSSHSHFA